MGDIPAVGSYLSRTEGLFQWVYLKWSESDADERNEGPVKKRSVLHFLVQDVLGTAANSDQQASFFAGERFSKDFLYEKSSSYISFPLTFRRTA